jgi:hypothetical protein
MGSNPFPPQGDAAIFQKLGHKCTLERFKHEITPDIISFIVAGLFICIDRWVSLLFSLKKIRLQGS